MTEDSHQGPQGTDLPSRGPFQPQEQEAWKLVTFGQVAGDLLPAHVGSPEAPEDELTQAAMADPGNVYLEPSQPESAPTLWRLIMVLLVAVAALAVVFWRG